MNEKEFIKLYALLGKCKYHLIKRATDPNLNYEISNDLWESIQSIDKLLQYVPTDMQKF